MTAACGNAFSTAAIKGTPRLRHVSVERAIASAWPRSSAWTPGNAPEVSTNVITGRLNRSASCISRIALRYPSGLPIPKLCLSRLAVSSPFSWPITITFCPRKVAKPPRIA